MACSCAGVLAQARMLVPGFNEGINQFINPVVQPGFTLHAHVFKVTSAMGFIEKNGFIFVIFPVSIKNGNL